MFSAPTSQGVRRVTVQVLRLVTAGRPPDVGAVRVAQLHCRGDRRCTTIQELAHAAHQHTKQLWSTTVSRFHDESREVAIDLYPIGPTEGGGRQRIAGITHEPQVIDQHEIVPTTVLIFSDVLTHSTPQRRKRRQGLGRHRTKLLTEKVP